MTCGKTVQKGDGSGEGGVTQLSGAGQRAGTERRSWNTSHGKFRSIQPWKKQGNLSLREDLGFPPATLISHTLGQMAVSSLTIRYPVPVTDRR